MLDESTGPPEIQTGRASHQLEAHLVWLYWLGAACLAPWIVYLFITQPPRHRAGELQALAVGLIVAMLAGLLGAAWLSWRRSPWTAMAASFAGTTTFIGAWFRVLTHSGGSRWSGSVPVFLAVVALVITVCVLVVDSELSGRTGGRTRWLPLALVVAGAALVPSLIVVLVAAPNQQIAHHLRAAWTGLDLFELSAMAATGVALHRGSAKAIVAATATGALLVCDAWINIIPAEGSARAEGVALAFVELPLAAISFWVAVRASNSLASLPT